MHLPDQRLHAMHLGLRLAKMVHHWAAASKATTCLSLQVLTVTFQDLLFRS